MIKRRGNTQATPSAQAPKVDEKAIERFGEGADNYKRSNLDPAAKHNFKSLSVGFNEYEYNLLTELSKKTNRSMLNILRVGMIEMAEKEGLLEK